MGSQAWPGTAAVVYRFLPPAPDPCLPLLPTTGRRNLRSATIVSNSPYNYSLQHPWAPSCLCQPGVGIPAYLLLASAPRQRKIPVGGDRQEAHIGKNLSTTTSVSCQPWHPAQPQSMQTLLHPDQLRAAVNVPALLYPCHGSTPAQDSTKAYMLPYCQT